MKNSNSKIVGVDEVGRGCLFGPVFAGAVVLNKDNEEILLNAGLKDSKTLSKKKISALSVLIKNNCLDWSIGEATAEEIDNQGIREATEFAMIRALKKLRENPTLIYVDGSLPIRGWEGPQKTFIRGDSRYPAISAASIIAKKSRDIFIQCLAENYPKYGLHSNVGYGTKEHIDAIKKYGISDLHRKTFLKKISNI